MGENVHKQYYSKVCTFHIFLNHITVHNILYSKFHAIVKFWFIANKLHLNNCYLQIFLFKFLIFTKLQIVILINYRVTQ